VKICILDPGLQDQKGSISHNLGDLIIQESLTKEIYQLFPGAELVRYATHEPMTAHQLSTLSSFPIVLVGGTNLLTSRFRPYNRWSARYNCWSNQWSIDLIDAIRIKNAILLGTGWVQYQGKPDLFSRLIYRAALSSQALHSVRDNYSRSQMIKAGVKNVLNTNCVTMWPLAEMNMARFPTHQAENALVVLTDYSQQPDTDRQLLELLKFRYKKVYAWPQGTGDADYLDRLGFDGIRLNRTLGDLDAFIQSEISFDYIGTRLHGGIRCLQNYRRALIIEVDNRAAEIARDTNLPTVKRKDFDYIERWIQRSQPLDIRLNLDAIQQWRSHTVQLAGSLTA